MQPRRGAAISHQPRLLVSELRMLGDALLSLPFVKGAQAKCEVHLCCTSQASVLFDGILPRERVISFTPPWLAERGKYGVGAWRQCGLREAVRRLRAVRADVAVCGWADARVHVLMGMSGAGVRIGFPMNRRNYLASEGGWRRRQMYVGRALSLAFRVAFRKPCITQRLDRRNYQQHHLDDWRQIAARLDVSLDLSIPWIPANSLQQAVVGGGLASWLGSMRARGESVWAIHPGARLPTKRWPTARFQQLIDTVFVPRGLPLVIICPPGESSLLPRTADQIVVETHGVSDLASVLGSVDNVACNDSLASHLAAALGKRVISIFGSGSPEWFAPFGNEDFVVRAPGCPYHPCMDRCRMPSRVCLDAVSVPMVADVIDRVWSVGGRR